MNSIAVTTPQTDPGVRSPAKIVVVDRLPFLFPEDETFDIGQDTRTPLALIEYRYDVPFKFTSTINKLTCKLGPAQMTAEEQRIMQAMGQRNNRASE